MSKSKPKKPNVEIYTDGSFFKHLSSGGWAGIITHDNGRKAVISGGECSPSVTNNTMEMTAVIEAVGSLDKPSNVTILSDSEYVIKGATKWLPNWKRNGFIKADKKPVLNEGLWRQIDELKKQHKIKFEYVPAHKSYSPIGNVLADGLAQDEALLAGKKNKY